MQTLTARQIADLIMNYLREENSGDLVGEYSATESYDYVRYDGALNLLEIGRRIADLQLINQRRVKPTGVRGS